MNARRWVALLVIGVGLVWLGLEARREHLAWSDLTVFFPGAGPLGPQNVPVAGDSFAGGIVGCLARSGGDATSLRKALVYGAVMGSFAVEEFGTRRLQKVTKDEIETRAKALLDMIRV